MGKLGLVSVRVICFDDEELAHFGRQSQERTLLHSSFIHKTQCGRNRWIRDDPPSLLMNEEIMDDRLTKGSKSKAFSEDEKAMRETKSWMVQAGMGLWSLWKQLSQFGGSTAAQVLLHLYMKDTKTLKWTSYRKSRSRRETNTFVRM